MAAVADKPRRLALRGYEGQMNGEAKVFEISQQTSDFLLELYRDAAGCFPRCNLPAGSRPCARRENRMLISAIFVESSHFLGNARLGMKSYGRAVTPPCHTVMNFRMGGFKLKLIHAVFFGVKFRHIRFNKLLFGI